MVNIVALISAALFALVHFALFGVLMTVWIGKKLIPADRNIVVFWAILSLLTSIALGLYSIAFAHSLGFLGVPQ